jgi:broad specificity phosphatase PhoE
LQFTVAVCYLSTFLCAGEFFMAMQLLLVRHGLTTALPGVFIGSSDLPLSGRGLGRMVDFSDRLGQVQLWYCSPMQRALQTVDALAGFGCTPAELIMDKRLREIDFGRWEMKTFAEISGTDSNHVEEWSRYLDFVFPQGEAVQDFISRVTAMLETLRSTDEEQVVVVAHGGVIRTMICLALGMSPQNYLLFDVVPASLAILELHSEGGILKGLNL